MLPITIIYHGSAVYFGLTFLAGFICGCIRVPFIEPLIGARYAQLIEMPIMFLAVWRAADVGVSELHRHVLWTTQGGKKRHMPIAMSAFLVGLLALVQLLAAEVVLYVLLNRSQGKTAWDWVGEMDGAVKVVFFGILSVMPLLPVWLC
ncbi:hypothetical protein B0H66DRAFT_383683 [Apodospora peruviana]|uniref:Uncharacterized protein n=1 Tax=Apodospora peruviana TaxID=516989 RepID=A0AAE0LZ13_9PEZI|nr:hypothetical protein B0H66DRAFT_383683 [Apodospora peruviana]